MKLIFYVFRDEMRKLWSLEHGASLQFRPQTSCFLLLCVIPSPSLLLRMGAFSEIVSKLDYSTWPSLLRTVLLSELGALHPGDCPSQAPQDGQSP